MLWFALVVWPANPADSCTSPYWSPDVYGGGPTTGTCRLDAMRMTVSELCFPLDETRTCGSALDYYAVLE